MERIRVQNLRCLADTGTIQIKPITVLVGANSSGKSSFLRVFPLLKQSAETRTLSGILLNEGDVNFGFFPEAVHRDADPSELGLGFGLRLSRGQYQGTSVNRFLIKPIQVMCSVRYTRRAKDTRYPYLSSVELTIANMSGYDKIEIVGDEDGILTKFQVNDFQANGETSHMRLRVGRGIVPTLGSSMGRKAGVEELEDDESPDEGLFERRLLIETHLLFHGRTTRSTRLSTLRSIGVGSSEEVLQRVKGADAVSTWSQNVANWDVNTTAFKRFRNLLLAKYTGEMLVGINNYVTQFARSVHYFQPIRASVQRDYLSRDVQVASVDPSGGNVAMVLASLSAPALKKFRVWLLEHFGFEIYPQSVGDGARIALRMKEAGSDAEFNLADMGFGFSQMLPFLVQIWYVVENDPGKSRFRPQYYGNPAIPATYIIAIEQPELHLHPALQAKVADLFVAMAALSAARGFPIRFVLETHSPAIIERLGAHVEAASLSRQDVQVLLFDRGEDERKSNTANVGISDFDEQGVLKNWPFGFLAPSPTPVVNPMAQTAGR